MCHLKGYFGCLFVLVLAGGSRLLDPALAKNVTSFDPKTQPGNLQRDLLLQVEQDGALGPPTLLLC